MEIQGVQSDSAAEWGSQGLEGQSTVHSEPLKFLLISIEFRVHLVGTVMRSVDCAKCRACVAVGAERRRGIVP